MINTLRCALLATLLGIAVNAHADIIKIAGILPTTGPLTQYGDMVREGMNTAVEMVNAKGGVDGHTFEIVLVDDGCEPKQAPMAANNVVNQGIKFVIGTICSGAAAGEAPIFNEQGVLMIIPAASSPIVTEGKNYDFVFRTIGRDDQQGPFIAKYIVDKLKPVKLAVLHDKQSYGQGLAKSVMENVTKAGLKVVMYEGINPGESDYSSVITDMKARGVDYVFFGGYHPEMGLLLRQGKELNLKAKFIGPEAVGNPDLNAIAGDAVEGMIISFPADYPEDPAIADVVKAFKDKGRNPAGAYQLTTYAAMQALFAGIHATGGTDPDAIQQWLHSHEVPSVIGNLSWDKQGDLKFFKFNIFSWHKDGSKSLIQ